MNMRTLGKVQFNSQEDALTHAYTTPIAKLAAELGVQGQAYLYVNDSDQIEAAIVPTDASPADEVQFIARFDPRYAA